MCQRIVCPTCGKPSYQGCGEHVEQILADVPVAQRCSCSTSGAARSRWRLLSRR